jgi:hypothetical protein
MSGKGGLAFQLVVGRALLVGRIGAQVRVTISVVVALAITLANVPRASGYDWTDEDCTRWQGGSKYAECVQAHARLADSDCTKWTKGEKEFAKCQRAHNIARVQECQRRGSGLTDGDGND